MNPRTLLWLLLMLCFFCQCTSRVIDSDIDLLYEQAKQNSKSLEQDQTIFFQQAKQKETQAIDPESRAKLAHIEALYYHKKGQRDSALICLDRGLALLEGDSEIKYELLISAARDAALLNRFSNYEDYMLHAVKLAQKYGEPQFAADCAGAQALYLLKTGKYEQAIPYLRQADSLLAANNLNRDRDYYQYAMAESYRNQKIYPQAFEHYLEAEKLAIENGNNYQLLLIQQGIARLYRRQKRYDEAAKWREKQLALAKKLNNQREIRASLEGLAIINTEKGDTAKANDLFKQSLKLAKDMNEPEAIGVALTNLGQFHSRLGNTRQAIQFYREAVEYKKQADLTPLSIIRSYKALAEAYTHAGKTEQAKATFALAVPLADSLESPLWKAELNKSIYKLYKQEGNYQKAIEYVTSYFNLQNEADKTEADNKLQELMVRYESREKDQQIVFQKQKLQTTQSIALATAVCLLLLVLLTVVLVANKKIRDKAVASIYKQHLQSQQKQELINQLIKEKNLTTQTNRDENKLLEKLICLLEEEQIFRKQDLSLEKLAQELGTNITYVSQLINKEFGCNFNALVNHHRVSYCKKQIRQQKNEAILMKEIGFEAGFSSQSTFYAAFKNEVGITPLQYQKTISLNKEELALN